MASARLDSMLFRSTPFMGYYRVSTESAGPARRHAPIMLTNGVHWRLYYQGARSVAEQFFEINLAAILGIEGQDGGLFAPTDAERRHLLSIR